MSKTSPLVQYIVVRKDLAWPAGALIAQACHAATSVIHMFYEHQDTKDYLADIDNMHKIVLQVENLRHILIHEPKQIFPIFREHS